ncbi:MAG TPA: hypothetical protein VMZ06_04970 [Candidatus Bathyarchaeia archaeon]|nr:hypothetical protein [Candidatus Bathyarchaeia archaeon]
MIVGIPREIREDEGRVGLIPSGVAAFVAHGHTVRRLMDVTYKAVADAFGMEYCEV